MLIKYFNYVCFVNLIFLVIAFGVFAEPIPFSLKRGIPEIEVVINDSIKATFAIDTGADQIYIDKSFAEKNGLLSGGKMPFRPTVGINDKVEAFQIFLRSLKVGATNQTIVGAVTIDLPHILKDTLSGLPNGVLGYSFLKNQRFLLDYIDSTIEFTINDSLLTETKSEQIPFVLNRHLIVVNTEIRDSVDSKMILDTGASYSLISPALAKILNLKDSTDVATIRLADRILTTNVKILVRDIRNITASLKNTSIGGILGTSFLLGRRLMVDYPNNQLIIFSNR